MARGPLAAAELATYPRDGEAGDVGWLDPGRDASARGLADRKGE